MNFKCHTLIRDWHAHVYFDASRRQCAWALREAIDLHFSGRINTGKFHEMPVGPHPMWSFQLVIRPLDFYEVVGWLLLNHGILDVFIHPNTGDGLRDHRDYALWIGESHVLNFSVFEAADQTEPHKV